MTNPHEIIGTAPNRSDVIVVPGLNSAAMRHTKDEELKKTHDWESEFAALGLKGDALQIALMRKKRSILAGQSQASGAPDKKDATGSFRGSSDGSKEKKGWGSSTGTIVL